MELVLVAFNIFCFITWGLIISAVGVVMLTIINNYYKIKVAL